MIHLHSSDSNSSENLFNVDSLELSFYHRLSDKSILNLYRNELLIWLPKSSLSLEKIGEMEIESRSILEDRNELGTIEEILIERLRKIYRYFGGGEFGGGKKGGGKARFVLV